MGKQNIKLKYIQRQDTATNHCWSVFIRRNGEIYRKSFYDKKLGGRASALLQARKWRDTTLEYLDEHHPKRRVLPPPNNKLFKHKTYPSKSSDLPVGVYRRVRKGANNTELIHYEVTWSENKKRHFCSFSASKCGSDENARKRAIELRQNVELMINRQRHVSSTQRVASGY
jgi:hypothetical protein